MKTIRVKITNSSYQPKAVPRRGGLVTVPARQEVTADILPLTEERLAFYRQHGLSIEPAGSGTTPARRRRRASEPSSPPAASSEPSGQGDLIDGQPDAAPSEDPAQDLVPALSGDAA